MITIITGLPGAGKTLNTIAEIDQEWSGKRPIYYVEKSAVDEAGAGIAGLNLAGWIPFGDASAWWDLPEGAVVVVDECQYVYPATGKTREQPDWVVRFTEHRKRGFDIYLITQDARLLSHYLRRLAGRHVHYHRPFGVSAASRWEWAKCVDKPDDFFTKKEAHSTKLVKHPRKYYAVYASANIHTVKRAVPKKLLLLPLAAVVVAGGAWSALSVLRSHAERPAAEGEQAKRAPARADTSISHSINVDPPVIPPALVRKAVNSDGRLSGRVSGPGFSWVLLELESGVSVRLALDACAIGFDGSVAWCEWGGQRYVQARAKRDPVRVSEVSAPSVLPQ